MNGGYKERRIKGDRVRGVVSNTERLKILRYTSTAAESLLWTHLQAKRLGGLKFRQQHGIGPYIVDFYCDERKLVIELDGSVHSSKSAQGYDKERQAFLEENGYVVLRFKNYEVETNIELVLHTIISTPPP